MRVLLISAPIGAGHMRAAEAVAGALKRQNADIETQVANVFDFIAPKCGQVILKAYLKILARFPEVYGRMYGWGNTNVFALWGREFVSRYLSRKMFAHIKAYQPSAIICTHATPAGLAAYLLRTRQISIPVMVAITDYVVHRLWIYPEIDRYFVADDVLRNYLCSCGIPLVRSETTGIPVEYAFQEAAERSDILRKLGLNPAVKTVLLMGGGAGLLPMKEIISAFTDTDDVLQIIAVTGKNILLYEELKTLQSLATHRLVVLGYAHNVHDIMSAADVLISKPGGVTTAEALCRCLPMIFYRPIPGQEEANAEFLQKKGAALRAHSVGEVIDFVHALLFGDTQMIMDLRNGIRKLRRPYAAECIAKSVLRECFP